MQEHLSARHSQYLRMGRVGLIGLLGMGVSLWFGLGHVTADLVYDGPEKPTDPPPGDYVAVWTGEELSKNLSAQTPALKYIRIAASVVVGQGDALAAAPFTSSHIDCAGNTLDFQKTSTFTVNEETWLAFYDCIIYASASEEAWAYRYVKGCAGSLAAVTAFKSVNLTCAPNSV